jgi:hypothetical protein
MSVYIDSTSRESGTSSDFVACIPGLSQYDTIVVKSAAVPMSTYFIQQRYNTFFVGLADREIIITLGVGQYTLTCWIHCLTQKLLAVPGLILSFPAGTEPQTGKFTITAPSEVLYLRFVGPGIAQGLGFPMDSTHYFENGVLVSQNCALLSCNPCVYLYSDMIDHPTENQILQELLSAGTPDFSYLTYNWAGSVELSSKRLKKVNTDRVRFWVMDTNGHPLDLNGLGIMLSLCLYKRSNLNELHHQSLLIDQVQKLGT